MHHQLWDPVHTAKLQLEAMIGASGMDLGYHIWLKMQVGSTRSTPEMQQHRLNAPVTGSSPCPLGHPPRQAMPPPLQELARGGIVLQSKDKFLALICIHANLHILYYLLL
ncbi:hypothetical protein DSO57_1033431 [Entomophthora muscae]|uniref:Uncharacterized protein n=1 Tax=Entomophthora muscae TaxID=34485 RepID=A0ACC2U9L4_9FUNG|nr:hypothetical protein DSO57_1033431 [Entomophthora muscae]